VVSPPIETQNAYLEKYCGPAGHLEQMLITDGPVLFGKISSIVLHITENRVEITQLGVSLASFPGLPCFFSSVYVDNNTQKQKSSEKRGRPDSIHHSSGCREGGAQPQVSLHTVE